MTRKSRDPRFFRHFDPAKWEREVSADLAPVLRVLLAEPGNAIASLGLENVKMPDLTVLLRHSPSAETLVETEALSAANPNMRIEPGWIACVEHYQAVEWDLASPVSPSPTPTKPSLLKRLFG